MQSTLDRSAVMEKAARSMARGELDTALKLYLQIFDKDSHDWSVGNTVGDLYVKMGRPNDAVSHFTMLAEQLAADGFAAKARALYRKIVRLQPGNEDARRRVDELDRQTAGETSPFLKRVLETARALRETAPVQPPVQPPAQPPVQAPVQTPVQTAVQTPVLPPVQTVQTPVLPPVQTAVQAFEEPAWVEAPVETPSPIEAPSPGDAVAERYRQMDTAAAAAIASGDHHGAAAFVERFLADHPHHVLALERLVEIGVEGRFDRELIDAQRRLADACVKAGHYRQAFDIAVDLCTRHPRDTRNHEQLGRVVEIARSHGRTFVIPPFEPEEPDVVVEVARPRLVPPPAPPLVTPPADVAVEVATSQPGPQPVTPPAAVIPSTGGSIAIGPPFGDLLKEWSDPTRSLEEIRHGLLEDAAAAAEEGYTQAVRMVDARQFMEAGRPLEEAMCLAHLRVPAGSQLARVYRDSGAPLDAMAILEWVAELPPADEDSGHQLAYELALTLESLGQEAQALGVYRELLAEVGPQYRDVALRVERLAAA